MADRDRVELRTTESSVLDVNSYVTLRVGSEVATLTAQEWAYLISHPKRGPALIECSTPSKNQS